MNLSRFWVQVAAEDDASEDSGGFLDADEGSVIFDGEEISKKPPYERELNTVFREVCLVSPFKCV